PAPLTPPRVSRLAILKRRRSFSFRSSSVNSLALVKIWKKSWLFWGSSPLGIPRSRPRILSQKLFALLQGLDLPLQEGVLQRHARVVHEDLQGLQVREGTSGLGVVPEQEGDRLPVGQQRDEGGLPGLEPPHLAHQVLGP